MPQRMLFKRLYLSNDNIYHKPITCIAVDLAAICI